MIGKLLVVDDDSDLRKTISVSLGTAYALSEASDGDEALRSIEKERPRLVLLDISMPGMSGIEVLQAALRIDASLIVIMLTGEDDIDIAKRALDMGAVMYVTKPFDMDYLRGEVKRLMRTGPDDDKGDDYRPWRVAP